MIMNAIIMKAIGMTLKVMAGRQIRPSSIN